MFVSEGRSFGQSSSQEFYNTPDSVFKVKGSCAEPGLTEFEKPFISDPWCDTGGYEVMDLGRVINSNLMGKGPDHQGKPELRFENVLSLEGSPVDLVIEVVTGDYEPGDPQANGKFGGRTRYNKGAAMGAISLATGTMTKFKASFKRSDGFAVYVPKLNLTFWDIDMPHDNLRERVAVFGYKKFYTVDQNGQETQGNSVAYMQKPGGGEFSAGRLQVTEPMDPESPTRDQRDAAVTFFFENVAEFFFELEVTWIGRALSGGGQSTDETDAEKSQLFFFSATAWELVAAIGVTIHGYANAIRECGQQLRWEKARDAITLLTKLEKRNLQPDSLPYASAVGACAFAAQWVSALDLLDEMTERRLPAEIAAYNAAIMAQLFDDIGEVGLDPDRRAYEAIDFKAKDGMEAVFPMHVLDIQVQAAYEGVATWRAALQWISSVGNVSDEDDPAQLEEKVCAFLRCCRGSAWPLGLSVLSSLQSQRLTPTTWIYNEILDARMASDDAPVSSEAPVPKFP
eukprot:s933_g4.t1